MLLEKGTRTMSQNKRVVYNKLVRDRIPEIIEANGGNCETMILDESTYAEQLEIKLAEELAEYVESQDVEELADVVEVIRALVESRGLTWEAFERLRLQKAESRGGFSKRIFLVSATAPT